MAGKKTNKKKTVKASPKNIEVVKTANKASDEPIKTVSKAESLKPFTELVTIALRQEWIKRYLIEFVEKTYEGCEVRVDAHNSRQICFHIDGIKVPEDGYFSVK